MAQSKISDLSVAASVADGDFVEIEDLAGPTSLKATAAQIVTAARVNAAGATMNTDFNANTVLAADADDTPAPLTIAEQRVLGRITAGNIKGLTAAEILTLINVAAGAEVNPDPISQAEAEAGTATTERIFSALRVKQAIDALAPAGSLPVADTTAVVKGSVDATKLVRIEADGLTTGITRAIAMPDQDVDLTPASGTFASAAQGSTADAALPKAGGQMSGNITMAGAETVDGRDLSVDGAKLDGVATGAEVNPAVVPQAEAEAGTATTERTWTAQRAKQAIVALVQSLAIDMADALLTRPKIKDFSETVKVFADFSGTPTINLEEGNVVEATAGASNTTLATSNWPASGSQGRITLYFHQGATARTIAWPGAVDWGSAGAPDLTTVSKTYVIVLTSIDAGTTIYGMAVHAP